MGVHFHCGQCGADYDLREPVWRCACGGLLDLVGGPAFERNAIDPARKGVWRYSASLPVEDSQRVSYDEGGTPLLPLTLLGREVWIKQEQLFTTGSYKDRGATVLISHARRLGIRQVVEDSSGNAGCAIAAYCARAGIACDVYVPASTSPGKLAQIAWYGARLVRVSGSREDTAQAAMAAAQQQYYASHSWNPLFFQGTKTFAFELCEQLSWQAPDWLFLPVGNGTLLLGAALGFRELQLAGVIDRVPRLCAVQAAGCAPLAQAYARRLEEAAPVEKRDTLAEGIAIARPVRGRQILQAVRQSDGCFVTVEEAEIVDALREAARQGFYVEPTAAATIAGVKRALTTIPEGQRVVSVFTGHGLKATEKLAKLLG
jgi:threonine synthase